MPFTRVDCSAAHRAAKTDRVRDNTVLTPSGLCLLEIQGELDYPDHAPAQVTDDSFITVDEIHDAVKVGRLEYDDKDPSKVVLFVGKSQRLVGSIVDLDVPLGVLRVPLDGQEGAAEPIQMVDIIKKKLIFSERPLPIM